MRKLSIVMMLTVLGVAAGAAMAIQLAANAPSQAEGFRQPSIMIDQLTANAKNLPVQQFDAF